jgi:Putative prokaryotic signal transducing protein
MNEPGSPSAGPVTVLTVRDPGVLALAQSLLDGADIPYFAKGESVQNLMPFLTWVEVQVAPEDAEEARALLADLAEP